MPPKFKFTRDEMIKAALDLTRENGISALTARALAARLGCSAKPIFGLFQNMQEVQQEVLGEANRLYQSYLQEEIASGKYPPYKASGMAYIRFAREEKELFKLLFMRDRSGEKVEEDKREVEQLLRLISESTGLDEKKAYLFHLEMWIYVHGIATMIATAYLDWDMQCIERFLSDEYAGLKYRYCGEKNGRSD